MLSASQAEEEQQKTAAAKNIWNIVEGDVITHQRTGDGMLMCVREVKADKHD